MNRGFSSFHPFTSFIYYVGALVLITLGQHPAFLISIMLLLAFLNVIQEKGRGIRNWGWTFILLGIFFFIINPVLNHRGTHILFYFNDNPIVLEAVMKGLMTSISLLCVLLLFLSYNHVITADKFLFLFAKLLPQWALLTMLAMRFVPLFRRRLTEIDAVQRSKGVSVTTGTLKKRMKNGILFVQILLTWSLEEAIQTADSMKARGYGIGKRTQYNHYKMHLKDCLFIVSILILTLLSIFGWYLGDLVLEIQPILESPVLEGREWLFFMIEVIYFAFPIIIDGKEKIHWKS